MNLLLRLLTVGSLLTAAPTFAATTFEGKVALAITTEKAKPMTMTYAMKGTKLRMEMDAEGHQMSTIMDMEKMEMLMLMPEQKKYMVMPLKKTMEKAAEHAETNTEVERTGKTEKILGYASDQILVKDKEKGTVTELWVASNLGTFMGMGNGGGGGMFGGRKSATAAKWEEVLKGKGGFPLRVVTTNAKGKEIYRMEATKIEPGSQPSSLFVPPEDYERFQMPDFGGLNPFKQN